MRTQKKSRALRGRIGFSPDALLWGTLGTIALVAYVGTGQPGAEVLRWLALVPMTTGLALKLHAEAFSASQASAPLAPTEEVARLCKMVQQLGAADRAAALDAVLRVLLEEFDFDRALVLLHDAEGERLTFGALSHWPPDPDTRLMLEQLEYALEGCADDAFLGQWCAGRTVRVQDDNTGFCQQTRLAWLCETLKLRNFLSVPLTTGPRLTGVILADNSLSGKAISPEQQTLLEALAAYVAILLENTRLYQRTDDQLSARVQELEIISRISRELSYTLSVERVLELTLDWALRFTGADAAAVALVATDDHHLHLVPGYGYPPEIWEQLSSHPWPSTKGISGRVARVAESRRPIWLNLEGGAVLRIARKDLAYFPDFDSSRYQGRRIVARGWIYRYRGRPTLQIRHPFSLRLLP